jgi:hypothetical protein
MEKGEMSEIAPWSNGADYTERLAMGMAQESPRQILRDRHLLGYCHGHAGWGRERALAVLDSLAPLIAEGSHRVTHADLLEARAEIFCHEGDDDTVSSLALEAISLFPDAPRTLLRLGHLLSHIYSRPLLPPHPTAFPVLEHALLAAESSHDFPTAGAARSLLDRLKGNSSIPRT